MPRSTEQLRAEVDRALAAGKPADAICYLAELVAAEPADRHARLALAVALGDAGSPAAALKVMRALADRLAHEGYLLPAMVVVRRALAHAPDDASLLATLKRLHVRGVRAKAGDLQVPPPLQSKSAAEGAVTAAQLLELPEPRRIEQATQVGITFPPAGQAAIPLPMPLFCELDQEGFVETVKRLRYRHVPPGTKLLVEGEPGDSLLVVASGHVDIERGGTSLAKLGPGSVLGEMALITGAPRSATAVAAEEVEVFELSRGDVSSLAQARPGIAEELVDYCRKRLIGNLLQTSPLFRRFDEATRYLLLDQFQRRGCQPGEHIIEQDSPGVGLFVLATGEVEVSVTNDAGERVVVANLGPGDVFGEISLLEHQATNATVTARDRVGLLFLPREKFQSVLDDSPGVRDYLESLSRDRIQASRAVHRAAEVLDADELIVL